jgi:hypothetical protein
MLYSVQFSQLEKMSKSNGLRLIEELPPLCESVNSSVRN